MPTPGPPSPRRNTLPNDLRTAPVFKAEGLAQPAEHRILVVVDDNDLVVAALREAGWPVRHAQWMPM